MKKQFFRGIVVLLSLAFMALPALSAVSIAPNDKGDLLIYPMYYAMEGIETNIEVINTSKTHCAVAKVIVRSHKYSIEVLDFLIYLTPNDVFTATLKYEGGQYVLVSTDDSLCLGATSIAAQASVDNPIALELYSPTYACTCATADSPDWGYIDVVEVTSYEIKIDRDNDGTLDAGIDEEGALNDIEVPGCVSTDAASTCCKQADGTILKAALFAKYQGDPGQDVYPTNILTGHAAIVFPGAEYALYKPTILKDYDNADWLDVGERDPVFQNLDELEAALSKNNLVIPYFNKSDAFTISWLTFPTKQTQCDKVIETGGNDCLDWKSDSCYFGKMTNYTPTYGVTIYDLKEHSRVLEGCVRSPCSDTPPKSLPEEVNLIFDWLGSGNPFAEGWTRVALEEVDLEDPCFADCDGDHEDDLAYVGSPVIGLIGQITPEGLSLMAPAYDFGAIAAAEGTASSGIWTTDGCFQLGCDCPTGE